MSERGIKITEEMIGLRPVNAPPTAVVGLIGTAPNWLTGLAKRPCDNATDKPMPTGSLRLITSDRHAAQFGPDIPGFTIPNALNAIMDYGTASIVVIDVFDPLKHIASVTNETVTLDDAGVAVLANKGIISANVKIATGALGETNALTEGTDFKLDQATGEIRRIKGGAIPPLAELTVTYSYGDPTKVTNTEIIGTTDAAGLRSGLQGFLDAAAKLGYKPRILIAPGFGAGSSVASALLAVADKINAHAYLDVPVGATIDDVVASRNGEGSLSLAIESARAVLCYPRVGVKNPATEEIIYEPLSQNLAGLACYADATRGLAESPSNLALNRVVSLETPVQWAMTDQDCEANRLNDVGVVTVVRPQGGAFRSWGNRSAAFPTETHPISFINVRAVGDYLIELVERIATPYVDRLYLPSTLRTIMDNAKAELENLIGKKWLTSADFRFLDEDNPDSDRVKGHVTYELSYAVPVPTGMIKIRSVLDANRLTQGQ